MMRVLLLFLWLTVCVDGFSVCPVKTQNTRVQCTSLVRLRQQKHENDDPLLINGDGSSNLAPLYQGDDVDIDEDDDVDCDIATKFAHDYRATKFIFIISDSTGVTAKSAVQKTLTQFDSCSNDDRLSDSVEDCFVSIRVFTFIRGPTAIHSIIRKAQEKDALVVFTMVEPTLKETTVEMCQASGVTAIDLLGPTLMGLSDYLDQTPIGVPRHELMNFRQNKNNTLQLSDVYFRRIQAVEFTLKTDDGQCPWLLGDAHVVLVGVSRTGKTPLSVVLSQTMGLKVANVPLVVDIVPPTELFHKTNPQRVFCLTIAPSELRKIRQSRLARISMESVDGYESSSDNKSSSNYADRSYLLKDLQHARSLAQQQGWTEVDVTGRAVEETASYISEMLNERFEDFCL